jgi:hypothetical protein
MEPWSTRKGFVRGELDWTCLSVVKASFRTLPRCKAPRARRGKRRARTRGRAALPPASPSRARVLLFPPTTLSELVLALLSQFTFIPCPVPRAQPLHLRACRASAAQLTRGLLVRVTYLYSRSLARSTLFPLNFNVNPFSCCVCYTRFSLGVCCEASVSGLRR